MSIIESEICVWKCSCCGAVTTSNEPNKVPSGFHHVSIRLIPEIIIDGQHQYGTSTVLCESCAKELLANLGK